jgi:hypothetical protein
MTFQKPFINRPGVLDDKVGDPEGYVTNDGMWAAVPIVNSKKFAIINFGSVVHTANNYTAAKNYILKEIKKIQKEVV